MLGPVILLGLALSVSVQADIIGVSSGGLVYAIDGSTGVFRTIGPTGDSGLHNSLAKDSSGVLYSVAAYDRLISINPTTGEATLVATITPELDVRGLAGSSDGTLYAISGVSLYRINASTGETTLVSTASGIDGLAGIQALAFSPTGVLYGYSVYRGLLTIDAETGATTDVNPSVSGLITQIQGLAFGPDGTLYGARGNLWRIDPSTDAYTIVGGGGIVIDGVDIRGIEWVPRAGPPIPEPASLTLVSLAALALGVVRCRRRA
jgi:hypothetical protein